MRPLYKGLLLGLIHIALIMSLGAKLLIDRATQPRVWAYATPYDPDLPIRGRYVSLRLEANTPERFGEAHRDEQRYWGKNYYFASLRLQKDQLVALPSDRDTGVHISPAPFPISRTGMIVEPIAYFIPEHIADPSRRPPGEELWVEVTIPKKGPPRPIRLGVKKGGQITPLIIQ